MKKIKAIIFDFDGVILESMDAKTKAFTFLFKDYPEHIEEIVKLHTSHGGMSRFEKFERIYRDFLRKPLSEDEKDKLGRRFSEYVYEAVLRCPFVEGAKEFLEKYHQKIPLFIASGTPEPEIKSIVKERGLEKYFKGVLGSPLKKGELILKIIKEFNLQTSEVVFIGDAIDDYEGAKEAGIRFIGRVSENNPFKGLKVEGILRNLFDLEKIVERKRLVFVEDELDLKILHLARKFRILNQEDFTNLLVVCCNYHLIDKAQAIFNNVKYIFDLVDINDIQYQTYNEASEAALLFFEKAKEGNYPHLHYSLLWHLQQIFHNILISKALIKLALEKIQTDSLLLLPSRKFPVNLYGDWGFRLKSGIFGAALERFCCERKNLQIKKIFWIFGVFSAPKLTFQFLPGQSIVERFLFICKQWAIAKQLSKQKQSSKKGIAKTIQDKKDKVIINWGVDLTRHTTLDELAASLSSSNLEAIHLLWWKRGEPPVLSGQQIIYKKSLKFYLRKRGFFSLALEMFRVLTDALSILKDNSFFQGKFYSKQFFSAYFYLYFYGTAIVEAYRKMVVPLFDKFPPKLFITSDISNHIGRIFVFTAREWGAEVYTFSHGCSLYTPWLAAQESLGDKILVSGQGVGTNIQRAGVSEDRIVIVGKKKKLLPSISSLQKEDKKIVAIMTSMKIGNWLEPRNLFSFFKTIEDLVAELLGSGFRVVIKSHKLADYWEFYDQLVQRYKNYPIQHVRRRWKKDELSLCSVAVFPGSISSTILDCQAAGVPIIYIDILSKVEKEILRYNISGCGVVAKTVEGATESVKKLFSDKEYFQNILEIGRQFYKNHVNMEKNFTEELTKIIRCPKY